MRFFIRNFLVMSIALALFFANAIFIFTNITSANANSSFATSISSINEYFVPGTNPWGTAFDSSGRVWVALPGCDLAPSCPSSTPPGKLALFSYTAQSWAIIVTLPAGYGQPVFVAVDGAGKVWFTMPVTNAIGMYDPASTTVSQWAVPTSSAGPWDITISSNGIIWFTEHYVNKIASFDPNAQTFHEISTPASNSQPYGITADSSNNIWFTENPDTVALIGEYTNQGTLQEYKIRNTSTNGTGLTPHLITIDTNGNIWWSEGWVATIGMLNVSSARPGTNNGVTEYPYTPTCTNCGAHTSGISADKQGLIWFDDSLQNIFGSFPAGGGSFSTYSTQGHPHDGLNIDTQNRIWFDEEFANKIAVAIPSSSSSTPTPTATSTPTPTSTLTPTSTPTSGTTLGQDTFQRANQSLWGTASDGQKWGGDANTSSAFSISGNSGKESNAGGTSYSAVLGPTTSNAEAFATFSMSSLTNSNTGVVLRWTDGNNWYKAFIDGASLILQKKVAGATTNLTSVPFAASANVSYTIHMRVVGSTLTANVWTASGSEPTGWMLTGSDTALTSGYCGIRLLTQTGSTTITSFRALSL